MGKILRETLSLLLTFGVAASGCGYGFQNSRSPLAEQDKIRKVFVAPLVNNTYKAGVENLVYNALLRTLQAHGRVVLVRHREDADAVLEGIVQSVVATQSATTAASALKPIGVGNPSLIVTSEYVANLACSFKLTRQVQIPGKQPVVWAGGFSRAKPFPASNQLGSYGTTSALINESEFDRALSDVSTSMMADVHEAMLAKF